MAIYEYLELNGQQLAQLGNGSKNAEGHSEGLTNLGRDHWRLHSVAVDAEGRPRYWLEREVDDPTEVEVSDLNFRT